MDVVDGSLDKNIIGSFVLYELGTTDNIQAEAIACLHSCDSNVYLCGHVFNKAFFIYEVVFV